MSAEQYPNLDQPDPRPNVPNVTTASGPSSLAAPTGSEWTKAKTHFEMAKAAMKLSSKTPQGAAMAIEHLERAAASLKSIGGVVPAMTKCPLCGIWHGGYGLCLRCEQKPMTERNAALARMLLSEVVRNHADKECADYNMCDDTPCEWCNQAKMVCDNFTPIATQNKDSATSKS